LAFELVAELAAFRSGPARAALDAGKPWVRDVRRHAGPELLKQVERFDLGIYSELATVALEATPPRDVESFVAALQRMDADSFQLRLLGADSQLTRTMVRPGTFERAIGGDDAARRELRSDLTDSRTTREAINRVLVTPPKALKAEILATVGEWAQRVLPAYAETATAVIERDASAIRDELARLPDERVLARVTNGVTYEPPPWISDVAIIPTVALRPFVIPLELRETAIFLCSVSDDALETDVSAPPRRLVKVAAALGDELRLRILHALGDEELSASQIAERLGLDRTTIHHHLGILRSAGLLAIRDEGERGWRYARGSDGVAMAAELDVYLSSDRQGSRPH
jgi:DNA-binding transcriptional ArsR family regulator